MKRYGRPHRGYERAIAEVVLRQAELIVELNKSDAKARETRMNLFIDVVGLFVIGMGVVRLCNALF